MYSSSWNRLLSGFENPHLLQSAQWAQFKSHTGWAPHFLVWRTAGDDLEMAVSATGEFQDVKPFAAALVLEREVVPGLSVMYAPKSPLMRDDQQRVFRERIISDLERYAKKARVIQLKIDPDLAVGWGVPGDEEALEVPETRAFRDDLVRRGWLFSRDQIQYRNTVLVDLREDEEHILARMKSKTRYNIRLSGRKGVTVRPGDEDDLPILYQMYADTSVRGDFTIRTEEYYLDLWQVFMDRDLDPELDPIAQPLVAEYEGQPIAGAVIFKFGDRAWYLHGMSLPEHSEKMAPHLVQWEAMRWAKSRGCAVYDMWGAPDAFEDSDPMWGVFRFKSGYGGEVMRGLGAWDFPARPLAYRLYTRWVPVLLNIMRWFGDRRTRKISRGES